VQHTGSRFSPFYLVERYIMPSSSRRFSRFCRKFISFCLVVMSSLRLHRRRSCHLCCLAVRPYVPPTHHTENPRRIPTTTSIGGGRGGRGGGPTARGRAWWGEENSEWGECPRRCWICKGSPRMELQLERKGKEAGNGRPAPGPRGSWHRPEAVEKVGTFFFSD
jgi:hypothetical protein